MKSKETMPERKNNDLLTALLSTDALGWSILVRLLVGLVVFFPEGIQKLIFPDILGAARLPISGFRYRKSWAPLWASSRRYAAS